MTEYELIDLSFNAMSQVLTSLGYYITVLSAYLVVAYVAGANLSRMEIVIISVLFVFGALIFCYGTYGYLIKHWEIVQEMQKINSEKQYFNNQYLRGLVAGSQVLGILVSLLFMYRRANK